MPNDEDTSGIDMKGKTRIIKEVITHLNKVEEKINMLKDGLSETKDLETVDKLDIINLKNAIEQIKFTLPAISPESLEKVKAIEKLSERIEKTEKIDAEINKLKSDLKKLEEGAYKKTAKASIPNDLDVRLRNLEHQLKECAFISHAEAQELEKKMKFSKHNVPKTNTCKKCGAVLKPKAKFCGKCGTKVKK